MSEVNRLVLLWGDHTDHDEANGAVRPTWPDTLDALVLSQIQPSPRGQG